MSEPTTCQLWVQPAGRRWRERSDRLHAATFGFWVACRGLSPVLVVAQWCSLPGFRGIRV